MVQPEEITVSSLFREFVEVIAQLRNPQGGCPWDLAQTNQSIRPYLLEETYEVLEAIDQGDDSELKKELGDVLLQVVLHAQIAKDRGAFAIEDVVAFVKEKIVSRHPHVFGDVKAANPLEASMSWERQKLKEQVGGREAAKKSLFAGVPVSLPALLRAHRISEKAAHVGFDWTDMQGVFAKVEEELLELKQEIKACEFTEINQPVTATGALSDSARERLEHEVGDVLFSAVQLSRWLGVAPEDALRHACDRFSARFETMQGFTSQAFNELSAEELESLWEKAKKAHEKQG